MSRNAVRIECYDCEAVIWVQRWLAFYCPACDATPGDKCFDLRYWSKRHTQMPHAERLQAVDETDRRYFPV